jgi:hypothetical protein
VIVASGRLGASRPPLDTCPAGLALQMVTLTTPGGNTGRAFGFIGNSVWRIVFEGP